MASSRVVAQKDSPKDGLDNKCLFAVFKFIKFTERVKCERVCKQWREVALSVNREQRCLCLLSSGAPEVTSNFCSNPGHQVSPNDFVFNVNKMPDKDPIVKRCPNLKALHIVCSEEPVLMEGQGRWMVYYCPRLEHLSFIDNCNGSAIRTEMIQILSETIVHLQLRFTPETSEEFEQESYVLCTALEQVPALSILSLNIPLTADCCHILSETCVKNLELRGTSFTPSGLTTYLSGSGKYLTDLNLLVEDDEQLGTICDSFKNLTSFHCSAGGNLENCGVIRKLDKLTSLFLSSWSETSFDKPLLQVMKGCPSLKSLSINAQVSDSSLKNIPVHLPLIERIQVAMSSEESLTDETMFALSQLQNLKYLSLEKCAVSDEGFKLPLNFCPLLNFVSVGLSKKMTADSIRCCLEAASRKKYRLVVTLPFLLNKAPAAELLKNVPFNLSLRFHPEGDF